IVVYCKKNYVKLRTYPIFACYFIRRLRSTKAKLSRSCASPKSCPILVIFLLNSRFNQWNAMVGWRMLSFNFQFLEAPYYSQLSWLMLPSGGPGRKDHHIILQGPLKESFAPSLFRSIAERQR